MKKRFYDFLIFGGCLLFTLILFFAFFSFSLDLCSAFFFFLNVIVFLQLIFNRLAGGGSAMDYCISQSVDARCCDNNNPCFFFVCTPLYAGSSVLQISEPQVCSLDKVPQACEWLLACLQVTPSALPAPPINSRAWCS